MSEFDGKHGRSKNKLTHLSPQMHHNNDSELKVFKKKYEQTKEELKR